MIFAATGDLQLANYTGHDYDAVLEVYFAQARVYDSQNRRFASRDPAWGHATQPSTIVRYLYCLDSPLTRIDPWGRVSLVEGTAAHIIIGAYITMLCVNSNKKVEFNVFNMDTSPDRRTPSGRGYADVVVTDDRENTCEVYEIKSSTYNRVEEYVEAGLKQLSSYVSAFKACTDPKKKDYTIAKPGTSLFPSLRGVILPFIIDSSRVLVLSVYDSRPGMIYYDLMPIGRDQPQEVVISDKRAAQLEALRKRLLKNPEPELVGVFAAETAEDIYYFTQVNEWLAKSKVTQKSQQVLYLTQLVTVSYWEIAYYDGTTVYYSGDADLTNALVLYNLYNTGSRVPPNIPTIKMPELPITC